MGTGLRHAVVLAAGFALGVGVACASKEKRDSRAPTTSVPIPGPDVAVPRDYAGLHNVVAFADGILSGSVPEGDAGFDTLHDMGVRTIISVDGAVPEVDEATSRGMRYVHLPIGYDGMEESRKLEIARAVKDLPGPVYIHCHHGKHRSAGAAGAALVTLGMLETDEATARMKVSGTSPNYKGLYACVAAATLATPQDLASVSGDFPEVSRPSGLVDGMVHIDHAFEHLKEIEKAGWGPSKEHPDLVPAAEAGILADHYRTLLDDEEVRGHTPEFISFMRRANDEATALEDGIVAGLPGEELSARFKVVAASCKECHGKYRD